MSYTYAGKTNFLIKSHIKSDFMFEQKEKKKTTQSLSCDWDQGTNFRSVSNTHRKGNMQQCKKSLTGKPKNNIGIYSKSNILLENTADIFIN